MGNGFGGDVGAIVSFRLMGWTILFPAVTLVAMVADGVDAEMVVLDVWEFAGV